MAPSELPLVSAYDGPFQYAWDNTSLATLRSCPRKYQYTNIMGLRPKAPNPHLTFGILYHEALEFYDHQRMKGMGWKDAVRETIRYALHRSYGWESDHRQKNRRFLVRAVHSYLYHFRNDPAKTIMLDNGLPAVELSFRFEIDLPSPKGFNYLLTGHLDRLAEFDNALWTVDHKTSVRQLGDDYIAQFKPHGQMMQYTMAGKVVYKQEIKGVLLNAVQLLAHGDQFTRFPVSFTQQQLDEWLDNTKFYIRMAEQYAANGFWPQNFESCHHYNGCPFRVICSKDPSVRDVFIRSHFVVDQWDPLKTRERTL